jgi:hypothetical protein
MRQYAGLTPFYVLRQKMPQNEGKSEPELQGLLVAFVLFAFLQRCEGVEIALEEPVLDHAIFFELALGVFPGDLGADAPSVLQHLPLIR